MNMLKHTVHSITFLPRAILLLGSVAFMLSSCSKVTVAGQHGQDSSAITFTDVAAKSVVTGPSDIGSFSVWGWRTDNSSATPTPAEVFSATEVSRTGTSWTYEGTRYWMLENTYDFYALYPDTATLTVEDRNGHKAAESAAYDADGTLTVTGFDSTSGHDLMTASNTGLSGTNPPQSVAFTFSHELSRLSFKLESNAVTVISAALYGVDYRGTLTKSASSAFWSPSEGGTATQDSTPFEVENPAATEGTATLFDDILMIPHSDLTEAVLSISYRKNSSSDPDEIEKLSLNLSEADVKAWEKGQSYRYTLQLNMGSISVNVSVLPWVQENTSVEW